MSSRLHNLGIVAAALSLSFSHAGPARAAGLAQPADRPIPLDQAFVPGELIVRFSGVPADSALQAISAEFPGATWRTIPHAPHPVNDPAGIHPLARVRLLTLPQGMDVLAARAQIIETPGVDLAHPNWIMTPAFVPNDPLYGSQYGPQISRAEDGWDLTQGDASVIVCVADTGINFDHEDFQDGAIWTNPGEIAGNGIDDDNNGFIDDVHGWDGINFDNDPRDGGGHGSHVAGTIGARLNNGVGMAGVANVTLVPFQVFSAQGGGTFEAIVQAIFYATDNGFHALNYSGGISGVDEPTLREAVEYAWDNGMVVVAAAGNGNSGVPHFPAAYPGAIAVSGTDRNDERYTSSNFGEYIDVAAPGVDVFSCWFNGVSAYETITGTSMSTPHVTGLVALMHTLDPDLTNQDVRDLLHAGVDDLGDPGFDIFFGHGRINIGKALNALLDRRMTISLPLGLPETLPEGSSTPLAVEILMHNGAQLRAGSEFMVVRRAGGDFVPVRMIPFWGDGTRFQYEPVLRNLLCEEDPEFYFSAATTQGEVFTLPADAPASLFQVLVGEFVASFADDATSDQGWTVQNNGATTGDWARALVVDDPGWSFDPPSDSGGDGFAFVTGVGSREDVDRGSTILISPTLDLSRGRVKITFDAFVNQNRIGQEDGLFVEIDSSDGAGPWTRIHEIRTADPNWRRVVIEQEDLDQAGVSMTSTMRLRFIAEDASPEGVVEAGVDGVLIERLACGGCVADFDDDGDTDGDDFFVFLDAFANSEDRADLEGDGDWDANDFFLYLDEFVAGC